MERAVTELVETAAGRAHRADPVLLRTGGPAGNARLTAWLGIVLFVAFAVEGFTLLQLHQTLSVHIFVGALLVPVAGAKTLTTTWRMSRYYLGNRPYREAGPPPMLLRLLGPAVVLTTLAVLGTGLALIATGRNDQVLFLHKASFVLWFAATTVHTIARAVPAVLIVGNRSHPTEVPGGALRAAVLSVVVAAGVVTGAVVLPLSHAWTRGGFDFHH